MIRRLWIAILFLFAIGIQAQETTITLPESDWMAVIWQQDDDTLHWINAEGEQVSIERPRHITDSNTRLYITPDGETMVMTGSFTDTSQEGIRFYKFATGETVAEHQTQSGEIIVPPVGEVFSDDSQYAALVLRTPDTLAWRILVFDTATGSVPYILNHDPRTIPLAFVTELNRYPEILAVFSNGDAEVDVRFQMVDPDQPGAQSYGWRATADYPAGDLRSDLWRFDTATGFDLMPDDDQSVLLTRINPAAGFPTIPGTGNSIIIMPDFSGEPYNLITVTENGVRNPRYLYGGRWIGYQYVTDNRTTWHIIDRNGREITILDDTVTDVFHTPDGFLAQTDDNQVYHLTEDNLTLDEAIFSADRDISIIYSTPVGADFTLEMVTLP